MQVEREAVLKMLDELGNFPTASKWTKAEMEKRLGRLGTILEEGAECESDECNELLEEIRDCDDEDGIEVTGDFPAKSAKGGKGGKAAARSTNGKAEKGGGKKGRPAGQKPGVISTIVELVQKASKTKPVTKEQVLEELTKRFGPKTEHKRDPDSMIKTINIQLPSRLNAEKNLGIVRAESGGYYIGKGK